MNKLFMWIAGAVVIAAVGFFAWQKMQAPAAVPQNGLIRVTSPAANALVTSPLSVAGEARGTWYFEASFPVELLDAQHHEILNAGGYQVAAFAAQAQGDWMTENFVPFTATLDFTPPATDTGFLVLKKDNPSGLPEHEASIEVPVRFR